MSALLLSHHDKGGIIISLLLISFSLTIWVTILYKGSLFSMMSEEAYTRLLPVALLGELLCLQLGSLFLTGRLRLEEGWKSSLILFGFFLTLWGLMSVTRAELSECTLNSQK